MALVIGQNIGTSTSSAMAAIGASNTAKRLAVRATYTTVSPSASLAYTLAEAGSQPVLFTATDGFGGSASVLATVTVVPALTLTALGTTAELPGQAVLLTGLATPLALLIAVLLHAAGVTSFAYALAIPLGALIACALTAVAASRRTRSMLHGVVLQALRPKRFPGLPILATAAPWFVVMLGLPVALQTDRSASPHDPLRHHCPLSRPRPNRRRSYPNRCCCLVQKRRRRR